MKELKNSSSGQKNEEVIQKLEREQMYKYCCDSDKMKQYFLNTACSLISRSGKKNLKRLVIASACHFKHDNCTAIYHCLTIKSKSK